uniref:RING-type domain-containing protein n=1 Tax=Kalanchoe fedtschenkoi TaxID=63787 RepID=A0A7N0ZVW0_KALFE
MNLVVFISLPLLFSSMVLTTSANVVLMGANITLSFDDIEANFAPSVKASGEAGVLFVAHPIDACSQLTNTPSVYANTTSPFALIIRGGCSFEDKVRKAQNAGFKAAIIYDDEDGGTLVAMAGNSAGINIHAVFIAKSSGEVLKKYAGYTDMELWIIPSFENSAWSIMAISFISLLAMSAVLATCFFVRRHRIRQDRPRASSRVREFHGMSSRLVKAMPSLIFTAVLEDNCTSSSCAICLEDYSVGEKLRILPCHHKFHAFCIDSWLTSWRTFCPVCKRDARTSNGELPASESTPLLSSRSSSVASTTIISSSRSSIASSSAIQISSSAARLTSGSRIHSVPSSPQIPQSIRSYQQSPSSFRYSPSLSISRSSMDLRNASSQRSYTSQFASPHSSGYPSLSHVNTRYMYPCYPSPSNASPLHAGSSSQQPNILHYSESATSISALDSAQSLPGC